MKIRLILLVLVCYSAPLLLTFALQGTPLAIWKQFFWLIISIIFIWDKKVPIRLKKAYLSGITILTIFGLFAYLLGFNVQRIFFAIWVYLSGVPFIILGFEINSTLQFNLLKKVVLILAVTVPAGLVLDGYFDLFKFLKLGNNSELFESRGEEYLRASFLFESPTALVNYYNFLLTLLLILQFYAKKLKFVIFSIFLQFLFIAGAFYTGSRQVLSTTLVIIIISWLVNLRKVRFRVLAFFLGIISLYFINKTNLINSLDEKRKDYYASRYNLKSLEKDERVLLWQEGLTQLNPSNFLYWFTGNGLGATMGQHANQDEYVHTHYESAILATFYEIGFFAWVILFFPMIRLIPFIRKHIHSPVKWIMITYILSFLFISFIAPGGIHYSGLIGFYILAGLILNFKKVEYFLTAKP